MPKIYLSPSSQTENMYADGIHCEAKVCRGIAKKVKKRLEKHGFTVRLAKKSLSVEGRIQDSNRFQPDFHICIHTNAGGGHGSRVYCHSSNTGHDLVKAIAKELADDTADGQVTPIANNSFAEIRKTAAKVIYIEVEFHDNKTGAKWILKHKETIAIDIAKPIREFYNGD